MKCCSPLHFQLQIPLNVPLNMKKNVETYRVPKGGPSGLNPIAIFMVILIKVSVVYLGLPTGPRSYSKTGNEFVNE